MHWWQWVLAVVAVGLVLDRMLLAAEGRGWVYWRRRSASGSSAGNALLSFHAIFEPDREHTVEESARQEADIDVAGDDEPLDVPPA